MTPAKSDSRAGLIVDFGGVLTTNVFASFRAFCAAEQLDPDLIRDRFMTDPSAFELLDGLETGRLAESAFEARLAALLGIEDHAALIDRLFEAIRPDFAMVEAVRQAKSLGVKTGLLSNSWGVGRMYDRAQFPELFVGVVISGEIGIRKPDPRIYALAAESVNLPPQECVFVDDLAHNLEPARALGMIGVHHISADQTIYELEELLGVVLR
ncbi:MAG: HAD family phosphatase [Solirubrobacterales bacterium]|nr:HAD family phosphatase [Solirubrobacterales bacterium]